MQKAILFIEEPACNETPFAGAVQELQRKDVSCSVCTPEDAVENLVPDRADRSVDMRRLAAAVAMRARQRGAAIQAQG